VVVFDGKPPVIVDCEDGREFPLGSQKRLSDHGKPTIGYAVVGRQRPAAALSYGQGQAVDRADRPRFIVRWFGRPRFRSQAV